MTEHPDYLSPYVRETMIRNHGEYRRFGSIHQGPSPLGEMYRHCLAADEYIASLERKLAAAQAEVDELNGAALYRGDH